MSIPPREEWERMLQKAERQAMEILSKYEKKCKDIEVIDQSKWEMLWGYIDKKNKEEISPKWPSFSFVSHSKGEGILKI